MVGEEHVAINEAKRRDSIGPRLVHKPNDGLATSPTSPLLVGISRLEPDILALIEKPTLGDDLKILFRTIPVVFLGTGAK